MLCREGSCCIVCGHTQSSLYNAIAQLIWCNSEICCCYSVQFSIHTVIAQHIWCYSELCDCYSVQFSIHSVIIVFNSLRYGTSCVTPTLLLPPAYQIYCFCDMFIIDQVWGIGLTIPLPPTLTNPV